MPENIYISNPVISIQSLLRTILFYDDNANSNLIPDGIYGPETTRAVTGFQEKNNIEANGIVDYETWNAIVNEYNNTLIQHAPPNKAAIYPFAEFIIRPYDENAHLFVIQAMMNNIADRYENVPKNELNGIHDETSVAAVEVLQVIFGSEPNGIIDKIFWEYLIGLYEVAVTVNFMLDN